MSSWTKAPTSRSAHSNSCNKHKVISGRTFCRRTRSESTCHADPSQALALISTTSRRQNVFSRSPHASSCAIIGVRIQERVSATWQRGTQLYRDVREGVRFPVGHRLLRTIALLAVMLSFTDAAWFAIFVLLLTDELVQPSSAYGIILALAAVGGTAACSPAASSPGSARLRCCGAGSW